MIKAKKQTIEPLFFPQHEIEEKKVLGLIVFLDSGGEVPPVVVAKYKDHYLPLDGHHRLEAHRRLGRSLEAWVVSGRAFDRLCMTYRNDAESYISCGGATLFEVAGKWQHQNN